MFKDNSLPSREISSAKKNFTHATKIDIETMKRSGAVGFIDWLGVHVGHLPLGNCVPVSLAGFRAGKIATLAASGLPTNAAEFPERPLEAARRTTHYPSA